MTIEQAAAEVGMDRPHLGHWEQGGFDPRSFKLTRLIRVYDAEVGESMEWIHRRAAYYHQLELRAMKRRR